MTTVLTIFNILGGLAIFLYGMKLMSDGMQKVAGDGMRRMLAIATTNRFTATLSGMLVTSIIQSSSATTVMVVGFASAGLLTLNQSLGVIFGANIGTTMTAWIVSFFGFKIKISLFALPMIAIGFFVQFIGKWKTLHRAGEAMVGFGFLFFGLDIMKDAIPDISQSPAVMAWIAQFRPDTFPALLLLIGVGTALTVILQSSSAVMAMTITCASKGYIDFPTAAALVLGENIGTTITANLAAIGATKTAKRAAIGHFLFNFIGVLWVAIIFKPFTGFVDSLIHSSDPITALPYKISAFHTIFNVANTAIMLCFIKQLSKMTLYILPKSKREDKGNELIFLTTRFASTPELAIQAARKEIERMTSISGRMVNKLIHALKVEDDAMFERLIKDALDAETDTDVIEHKINTYLGTLAHQHISSTVLNEILALMDITNSVERMADCGQKIAYIIKEDRTKHEFNETDKDNIETLAKKVKVVISDAKKSLLHFESAGKEREAEAFLTKAVQNENELNAMRNNYRQERNLRMVKDPSFTPESATHYADVLSSLERMGDFALRIVENSLGRKIRSKEHVLETLNVEKK